MDGLQKFLDAVAQIIGTLLDACKDALNFIVRLFKTLMSGLHRIAVQCLQLIFYAGPFAGLLFAGLDLKSSLLFWVGIVTLALPFVVAVASLLSKGIAKWNRSPNQELSPRTSGDEQITFNVTLILNVLTVLFILDWYFQAGQALSLWNLLLKAISR